GTFSERRTARHRTCSWLSYALYCKVDGGDSRVKSFFEIFVIRRPCRARCQAPFRDLIRRPQSQPKFFSKRHSEEPVPEKLARRCAPAYDDAVRLNQSRLTDPLKMSTSDNGHRTIQRGAQILGAVARGASCVLCLVVLYVGLYFALLERKVYRSAGVD